MSLECSLYTTLCTLLIHKWSCINEACSRCCYKETLIDTFLPITTVSSTVQRWGMKTTAEGRVQYWFDSFQYEFPPCLQSSLPSESALLTLPHFHVIQRLHAGCEVRVLSGWDASPQQGTMYTHTFTHSFTLILANPSAGVFAGGNPCGRVENTTALMFWLREKTELVFTWNPPQSEASYQLFRLQRAPSEGERWGLWAAVCRMVPEEVRPLSWRCGSSLQQHVQPKWVVYRACLHGAAALDLMLGPLSPGLSQDCLGTQALICQLILLHEGTSVASLA